MLDAAMMSAMEPILFQRHRIFASIAVMALFAVAITTAVLRISALEEAEISARHEAAAQEAAQVNADFEAHKAAIRASILADITGGKFDEADALLKKYQPFAHDELEALKASYDRAREKSAAARVGRERSNDEHSKTAGG
jgi:hypothetical protein